MPREQLPQGDDVGDDWVPAPRTTALQMARNACIEYLKSSGEAQLASENAAELAMKEKWKPAALGMWTDALEDTDDPSHAWTVEAMRYVQRQGYRPYCCTQEQDRWCWFDLSKKIEEMEDGPSDVEPWLFAILHGKLETNFRIYGSGIEALEDMIGSLADWFRSGRRLDDKDQPVPVPKTESDATPDERAEVLDPNLM